MYLHRPQNLDVYELPAVCLFFGGETVTVLSGSRQIPDEYTRAASLNVDIFAENPIAPVHGHRVEELLNRIGRQVEMAFFDDIFFSRRLPGSTGALSDPGLLAGAVLESVQPYDVEVSDRIVLCQRLSFTLSYIDLAFSRKKAEFFDSYLVEIRKNGWDEDTVDPVLTSAEGDL